MNMKASRPQARDDAYGVTVGHSSGGSFSWSDLRKDALRRGPGGDDPRRLVTIESIIALTAVSRRPPSAIKQVTSW